MPFTVKAEYRGTTRKFTFYQLPNWQELYEQLYKVFPIGGSYTLSHLLLSHNEDPSSGRILIGIDVANAEAYDTAVTPFLSTHNSGGMLRFTVNDVPRRKQPSSSSTTNGPDVTVHVSEAYNDIAMPAAEDTSDQSPMHTDDDLSEGLTLSRAHTFHGRGTGRHHFGQRHHRDRDATSSREPTSHHGERRRTTGPLDEVHPHPYRPHGPAPIQILPWLGPGPERPLPHPPFPSHPHDRYSTPAFPFTAPPVQMQPQEDAEMPSLDSVPSASMSTTSLPTSSASTIKEEVKDMIGSFVGSLNATLARGGISQLTLVDSSEHLPAPETQPLSPIEEAEVAAIKQGLPHPRVSCDHCGQRIFGLRYNCSNCPNFDLCHSCVTEKNAKDNHSLYHHFHKMLPPVIEKEKGKENAAPVHRASCDNCAKRIVGTRHKCSACPDYDMCDGCYSDYRGAHRLEHDFYHYDKPSDVPSHPVPGILRTGIAVAEEVAKAVSKGVADLSTSPLGQLDSGAIRRQHRRSESNSVKKPLHPANCDVCRQPIRGIRFKCLDIACPDYDLCSTCVLEKRSKHDLEHEFIALHDPMRNVQVHIVWDDDDEATVHHDVGGEANKAARHNAFCDMCKVDIDGVRWKCIECVDYDLCSACSSEQRSKHRNGTHKFVRIASPGQIYVHQAREIAPTPRPQQMASEPLPPTHNPEFNGNTVHNATCDLCDSRVLGVRYKCTRCPDFDVCAACFPITAEQHPHHAFVKVSKPSDIMTPKEQYDEVHPAICDSCNTHIIGIRFKCLHPDCTNFDLCQHCEALPIPVHPANHPLVKFKHDFVGETSNMTDYSKIFEFIRTGGLRVGPPAAVAAVVVPTPRTPSPQPEVVERVSSPVMEAPVVRVMIPREDIEVPSSRTVEEDFPSVPAEEPAMMMMTDESAPVSIPVSIPVASQPTPQHEQLQQFFQSLLNTPEPVDPSPFSDSHAEVVEEVTVEQVAQPMDASIEELPTQPIVPSPSIKPISPPASPLPIPAAVPVPIPPRASPPTPPSPVFSAVFVTDNSIDDGHVFTPGTVFVKSWRLRNNGNVAWPETTVVEFVGGERCAIEDGKSPMSYKVGKVENGALVDIIVDHMKAPSAKGRFTSYWRLKTEVDGVAFGDQLWCDISVDESPNSSMTSSSVIMMPQAAPASETAGSDDGEVVSVPRAVSPSTLRSASPTPTDWSATSGSSLWEDARPASGNPPPAGFHTLHRQPSSEFVFVEDEDDF